MQCGSYKQASSPNHDLWLAAVVFQSQLLWIRIFQHDKMAGRIQDGDRLYPSR